MVAFCVGADVVARLKRALTASEATYLAGDIAEAQLLVIEELGCGTEPYALVGDVPEAVTIVTSRIVARLLKQNASNADGNAESQTANVGPFGQTVKFTPGSTSGAPWLTKSDRTSLKPYSCNGKAFAVDTAPDTSTVGYYGEPWYSNVG